MKTKTLWAVGIVVYFMIVAILIDQRGVFRQKGNQKCSRQIIGVVDSINTSQFSTVDEVIRYAVESYEAHYVDSIFNCVMDYKDIRNVAMVLLEQAPRITKQDIVMEYVINKDRYDSVYQ